MKPFPESDFISLCETIPGSFLILAPDLTVVAVSNGFLELTQTDREAITGRKFLNRSAADITSHNTNALDFPDELFRSRNLYQLTGDQYLAPGKGGLLTGKNLAVFYTLVTDEKEEPSCILHCIIDVTDTDGDNKKRLKAENEYHLLLQRLKENAVFTTNPEGCLTVSNNTAQQLFASLNAYNGGYASDELPAAIRENEIKTTDWYAAYDFDISGQKRLEREITHLASIVEESSDAIISRYIDRRLISWNKGAEVLFGYTREEAIGKTASELGIVNITEQEVEAIDAEIVRAGTWKSEREFYHRNGTSFFGSFTANAVKNEKQEVSAIFFVIKDISLHRQLEQQLKKANEELEEKVRIRTEELAKRETRFRALIENSNDVITLMDGSFKLIYRSPPATRILGWTDGDMIGVEATKNIHADDKAYAANVVKEVMANPGKIISTRFRMRHKEGHYLWLEGSLTNLLEDSDVRAVVFNFRDISKRVVAEEKLSASEKQFRTTLNDMLEGIQIHDFNWRYVYVNDALERFAGCRREELLGIKLMDQYPGIEHTALFRTLDECMQQRVARRFETEFVFPDGRRSDFMLSIQPHPEGLLILSVDITKAKKAENALKEEQDKFARIMATSPGLIYSFRLAPDGSLSFPYASNAFEEIFGVPHEAAAENVNLIIDAYLEEDLEKVLSSIAASARDMTAWQLQFRYKHPTKGLVWLDGNSIPTAAPDGSILWHGVITDVTERKQAEDKINEQNQRLKTLSDNLPEIMLFQMTAETFEKRRFTYVSSAVSRLTGRTPGEIMNDPSILYSMIEKEDIPQMMAAERESFEQMTPFNAEVRFRDYKGQLHWLQLISSPRRLNNGQMVWDGFHLDITEKKLAEQQREFDSNNLKALINNTHDLMWSVDRNYKLITSNEAFDNVIIRLSGRKIEKGANTLIRELNNSQLKHYKAYYDRAFSGEAFTVTEHDDNVADFWSELSFYPIYDGATVVGTACFSRNITEKKRAEELIRKSNERFELVVTATNDVIWDWDINKNQIWRNRNFFAHFGYDESLNLSDIDEWKKFIHADDQQRVLDGIGSGVKNRKHFWADEYRFIKADRSVAYVADCGYFLYDENGYPYRMVGAMADITERKMAEQALQKSFEEKQALAERMTTILNTLPANIALLDEKGVIIDMNEAWINFGDTNGLSGSNYFLGANYIDISHKAFGKQRKAGQAAARGIRSVLKGEKDEYVLEYECDSQAEKSWYRMVVTPLRHHQYGGAVVMHTDISELRRLEQQRMNAKMEEQQMIAKAMLMGQEKERNYIGQELHDNVNQILAGTKLYLGLAGEKNHELGEMIRYPMELLDSSMKEIRQLCHKMVTPLRDIALDGLIQDLLLRLDVGTDIKTTFTYAVPQLMISDDLKVNIYRIIQELVNNILKYAAAQNVTVAVTGGKAGIEVTVTDDGIGFDPYIKREGIGISNIITRVKSFNGEIDIKSSAGKGCITSIQFPC